MTTRYAAIGLPVQHPTDFNEYVAQLVDYGELLPHPHGVGMYIRWDTGHGAELWAQVAESGEILSIEPHFAGRSRIRAEITQRFEDPESLALAGSFAAVVHDTQGGDWPLFFDSPNYGLHFAENLPRDEQLQLAIFASTLTIFPDLESLLAANTSGAELSLPQITPQVQAEPGERPSALVTITGTILRAALLSNPVGNASFWWLNIQTINGTLDVVCAPAAINGNPINGGILYCQGWMTGCIVTDRPDIPC